MQVPIHWTMTQAFVTTATLANRASTRRYQALAVNVAWTIKRQGRWKECLNILVPTLESELCHFVAGTVFATVLVYDL